MEALKEADRSGKGRAAPSTGTNVGKDSLVRRASRREVGGMESGG